MKSVVVGGGVIGLLSSILLARKGQRVVLIERDNYIGGLLSSFESESGAKYDYGTHIPAKTGIKELDEILYGDSDTEQNNYFRFDYLKSENYFRGKWFTSSPLIDTRSLSGQLYAEGVVQLLISTGEDNEKYLGEYLRGHFGEIFTDHIYRPVLRKLLDEAPEELSSQVLKIFGLQRLIALTSEDTKALKTIEKYDSRLGYHSYTDGTPSTYYVYPKGNNGIGLWVEQLTEKAEEQGVEIITSDSIATIEHNQGNLVAVETSAGTRIECENLIWTIATPLAYKCAGLSFEGMPPKFRTTILLHFEFDRSFKKSFPQYLLCWQPEYLSYRITLYPNITNDDTRSSFNNLTVEFTASEIVGSITGKS